MHESKIFLKEKEQIDDLLKRNYQIMRVEENLYGTFVSFQLVNQENRNEAKTLRLLTANGRKYLTNQLSLDKQETG